MAIFVWSPREGSTNWFNNLTRQKFGKYICWNINILYIYNKNEKKTNNSLEINCPVSKINHYRLHSLKVIKLKTVSNPKSDVT